MRAGFLNVFGTMHLTKCGCVAMSWPIRLASCSL